MYKSFRAFEKKTPNEEELIPASAEAKICLNCPLPAKKCKPLSCERYKAEIKKIKGAVK